MRKTPPLNTLIGVSSDARGLKFGLSLYIYPYFLYALASLRRAAKSHVLTQLHVHIPIYCNWGCHYIYWFCHYIYWFFHYIYWFFHYIYWFCHYIYWFCHYIYWFCHYIIVLSLHILVLPLHILVLQLHIYWFCHYIYWFLPLHIFVCHDIIWFFAIYVSCQFTVRICVVLKLASNDKEVFEPAS